MIGSIAILAIVGLGNPEKDYSKTRHNMGFDVINKLSEKYNIKVEKKGLDSLYGTGIIENEKSEIWFTLENWIFMSGWYTSGSPFTWELRRSVWGRGLDSIYIVCP